MVKQISMIMRALRMSKVGLWHTREHRVQRTRIKAVRTTSNPPLDPPKNGWNVCLHTFPGRVELLRQQVIAAAHAANRCQLRFG